MSAYLVVVLSYPDQTRPVDARYAMRNALSRINRIGPSYSVDRNTPLSSSCVAHQVFSHRCEHFRMAQSVLELET